MATEKELLHQQLGDNKGSSLSLSHHADPSNNTHAHQSSDDRHPSTGHPMDSGNEEIDHADPFTVDDFYDRKSRRTR